MTLNTENPRFRNYIKKAKPNLKDGDSITTYYLNVGGRVDRSAEKWWKQYFSKSGFSTNNLNIIPEL
jgi:hypothetical protein